MSLWYKYLRGTTWDGSFVSVPFFSQNASWSQEEAWSQPWPHEPVANSTEGSRTWSRIPSRNCLQRSTPGIPFPPGRTAAHKTHMLKKSNRSYGGAFRTQAVEGTSYAKHHPLHTLLWCLWLKVMRKKHFVVWMRNGHSMWSHWFLKLICAATILINSQCYITSYFETQYLMTNISVNIIYFFIKKWF